MTAPAGMAYRARNGQFAVTAAPPAGSQWFPGKIPVPSTAIIQVTRSHRSWPAMCKIMLIPGNWLLLDSGDAEAYFDCTLRYAIRPTEVPAPASPLSGNVTRSVGSKGAGRQTDNCLLALIFCEPRYAPYSWRRAGCTESAHCTNRAKFIKKNHRKPFLSKVDICEARTRFFTMVSRT